jgi:hypothetical protein
MNHKIKLIPVLVLLFIVSSCSQSGTTKTDTERLVGKWKAAEQTSFRGKEIEFTPGRQVVLTLEDGGKQNGQYEVNDNIITFSIGDAPPFKMYFRFENGNLFLTTTQNIQTTYEKMSD